LFSHMHSHLGQCWHTLQRPFLHVQEGVEGAMVDDTVVKAVRIKYEQRRCEKTEEMLIGPKPGFDPLRVMLEDRQYREL
jgi:hypothetical protein